MSFSLYNVQTQTFSTAPGQLGGFKSTEMFDVGVVNGQPSIAFLGATTPGQNPARGLFAWTPNTGLVQLATFTSPETGVAVATDGRHVAYQIGSRPPGQDPFGATYRVEVRPISGGAPTVLTEDARFAGYQLGYLKLRDGVLTFEEKVANSDNINAKVWSAAQGLVTLNNTSFPHTRQDVGSGVAVHFAPWGASNRPGLNTWNGITGLSTPRAETTGWGGHISGNYLYFTFEGMIYRTPLS